MGLFFLNFFLKQFINMNSKRCFNSILRTSQLKTNNGLQLRKLSIPLNQSNYSSPFNQTQIRMTHTLKGWIRVTEREKQRRIQVYEKLQSKGAFEEWLETVRRDTTGKKVRKYRKEGLIPAMIFGGPFDPILINVQKKDINKFVYTEGFLGRNYTIILEGKNISF